MAENTQLFDRLPVGLVDKLKQQVNLAGELKSICYRKSDGLDSTYRFDLDSEFDLVDVIIIYNIDKEMQWSFEAYLEKWIQTQIDPYNKLERCFHNEYCS